MEEKLYGFHIYVRYDNIKYLSTDNLSPGNKRLKGKNTWKDSLRTSEVLTACIVTNLSSDEAVNDALYQKT